jgi:tubulin---tyrosine ligase
MGSCNDRTHAIVDYEDQYVQPLLLAALRARLPPEVLVLIDSATPTSLEDVPIDRKILQWRQYESIDFDRLMLCPTTTLANSYIIRKALIRKHYLSNTVAHWIAKHPESLLKDHVKPAVDFEVDYAEFLDDALDQAEAWELRGSWRRNLEVDEGKIEVSKEWWILKPGMSDRGQGIRLFSSEEELKAIFEEWDPPESDEDDDDDGVDGDESIVNGMNDEAEDFQQSNGVVTSHLRHFIAQPYIHPPLLMPESHPSAGRKFHIRTYILAVGALKVYVYKRMLALFAAEPYTAPGTSSNEQLSAHLTNTCLQSGEREGSVHDFWDLPSEVHGRNDWRESALKQICDITGEVFEAAARSMSIHFQPLPNAFEVFGLDFMVDAGSNVWLLEVNAFPDFAQTGDELKGLVSGLFEGVVDLAVKPFFGIRHEPDSNMIKVLDIDLGRG